MEYGAENIYTSNSNNLCKVVQDTSQQGSPGTSSLTPTSFATYQSTSTDQSKNFKEPNNEPFSFTNYKASPNIRRNSATKMAAAYSNQQYEPQAGNQRIVDISTHSIPEEQSVTMPSHWDYVTSANPAFNHCTSASENFGGVSAFPEFDPEITDLSQQFNSACDGVSLIDFKQVSGQDYNPFPSAFDYGLAGRRFSESTWSISSAGPAYDTPSTQEEFPPFESTGFVPEPDSWTLTDANVDTLSPLPSPAKVQRDHMRSRSGSRSRVSLSYGAARASPYSVDNRRWKRWSIGCAQPSGLPASQGGPVLSEGFYGYGNTPNASRTAHQPAAQKPVFETPNYYSRYHGLSTKNLTSFFSHTAPVPVKPFSAKKSFILESNSEQQIGTCASHCADDAQAPDLLSTLHEAPCDPPEEDMNPSDPDLKPYEQEPRFAGDLYTPRWVRGHGNKREGWCGLCKPGRWLVLKNSAFWYDKSFTHGVSAATGIAFQPPQETRRTDTNPDVWEGLCGGCGDWIALVSSKKKGTTWFRHAYKCHTHLKVKDSPKRRRESSTAARARAASSASLSSLSAMPVKEPEDIIPTPGSKEGEFASAPESFDNVSLGSMNITSSNPTSTCSLATPLPLEQATLMAPPPVTSMSYQGFTGYL